MGGAAHYMGESTKLGSIGRGGGGSLPHPSQSPLHPPTMGKPVFWICYETLAIIMFGIFGFDIDKKFSFNHYLLFKLSFTGL